MGTPASINETNVNASHWQASIAMEFTAEQHKTIVSNCRHFGPLRFQKAFYPEGDKIPHVYILHPPGGVVGGDLLDITINVQENANALITTPAANKYYRSNVHWAKQNHHLTIAKNASLEWLPQENIVYNNAWVKSRTKITLDDSSQFIGWEIICLGRPACHEQFNQGAYHLSLEIWRNKIPLYIDRIQFNGADSIMNEQWGLGNYPVIGTLVCATDKKILATEIRDKTASHSDKHLFSVTVLDGILICRFLGYHTETAKQLFMVAWEIIRKEVLARKACAPRIWKT